MSKQKNKCYIYKNDLKFNENIDIQQSEFESDNVKNIYNNFKEKPKIELRIEDSKMENYKYLDLSKLDINDNLLGELFKLDRIKSILSQIEFLDLSNNRLNIMPNISKFPNIVYLNISYNNIGGTIDNNILEELTCIGNKITSVKSKSLYRLNAGNNIINKVDTPKIQTMIISSNKLDWIPSYIGLKYLECIDNNISAIDNMIELEELYIGNNRVMDIKNMPKLKVLNCIGNPINKIKYFEKLKLLMTTIPNISSQYQISNISKIKSDYLINFKV